MRARIRQKLDKYGDCVWVVETKNTWLPWWITRNWSSTKSRAEIMAKVLASPEILEVTK